VVHCRYTRGGGGGHYISLYIRDEGRRGGHEVCVSYVCRTSAQLHAWGKHRGSKVLAGSLDTCIVHAIFGDVVIIMWM
jgi:hypothetical protein